MLSRAFKVILPVLAFLMAVAVAIAAQGNEFLVLDNGEVSFNGKSHATFSAYFKSEEFHAAGRRCGVDRVAVGGVANKIAKSAGDCTVYLTTIADEYWPDPVSYVVPVVFHVITNSAGDGNVSDERIREQVRVLNEDYRAMAGTLGAQGFNTAIQFRLVGVTRTVSDAWFGDADEVGYKQALGWDQSKYLNVYTNSASGYLGYAYYPQDAAGSVVDGVVMLYSVVGGRDLPGVAPYDQGRTLVHEVGHYFGLAHTFEGGCGEGYAAGDLIADTPAEDDAHFGCSPSTTCGSDDDIHNYMNYTDDACMWRFTSEQGNRAVCGLVNYRPQAYSVARGFPPMIMLLGQ